MIEKVPARPVLVRLPNMAFIDIFPAMLDASGQPRPELFVADRLHMNADGYAIWTKIVGPFL